MQRNLKIYLTLQFSCNKVKVLTRIGGVGKRMQWNLIRLRKEAGLTQKKIATAIGMDAGSYGRKERGEIEFRISEMIAIHKLLNASMDQIFLPPDCNLIAEIKK